MASGPVFREGEPALLLDDRGRKYLLRLRASGVFRYHKGSLDHSRLIGSPDGTTLLSTNGSPLIALRPLLGDYILKMRRGAQVVYPKDLGPVLMYADIRPGLTVLEAGTGSGALTLALARAVGPSGEVISYELREDHAKRGKSNIVRYFGGVPDWLDLRIGDIAETLAEINHDRLVLDLPEPWRLLPAATESLRSGGVLCSYLPTVPQLEQLHKAMESTNRFVSVESFEVLLRTWRVAGRSVRPDHGMVGHTGFLTVGRCIEPGAG